MRDIWKAIYPVFILWLAVIVMADVYSWQPHPKQAEALSRGEDEILYGGARSGGKTDAGQAWLVEPEYIANEWYRGLVVRKNAKDLQEWISRIRILYKPLGARIGGMPLTIKFTCGAEIYTGHLKDKSSYEAYQGFNLQKLLIEELTQIPSESIFEQMTSSVRSGRSGLRAQTFCTANPGGRGHNWVKKRFVLKAREQTYTTPEGLTRIFIPATVYDNPHNDEKYIARLKSIKDKNLRKAWLDGNWDVFIGQYFEKWDVEVHVIQRINGKYFFPDGRQFIMDPAWNYYRGLDWGYAAPAAVGWMVVNFEGEHIMYRELYDTKLTPTQVGQNIIEHSPGNEPVVATIADPSIWAKTQHVSGQKTETTKSIADLLAETGVPCIPGNNDRINGWNRMRDLLYHDISQRPKLYITEDCVNTIETIPTLAYDENKVEDLDTDGEDHLADMLRYMLMHTYGAKLPAPPKTQVDKIIDRITTAPDDAAVAWNNL